MNVSQLIEKLQQVPGDTLVCIEGEQIFEELDSVYVMPAWVERLTNWTAIYNPSPRGFNENTVLISPYGQDPDLRRL